MPTEQMFSINKASGQDMPARLDVSSISQDWVAAAAAATDENRPQDALALLLPMEQGSSDPGLHYELGRACRNSGDMMMAMQAFNRAVELGLKSPEIFNEIAMTLECIGHPDLAAQSMLQALAQQPEEPVLHYNLAAILTGMSQFTDARKACELALYHAPDFLPAQELLAVLQTAAAQP